MPEYTTEELITLFIDAISDRIEEVSFELGGDLPSHVQLMDNIQGQLGDIERRMKNESYLDSEDSRRDVDTLVDLLDEVYPSDHRKKMSDDVKKALYWMAGGS